VIRRTVATWIDPGVRRVQKDADSAWRLCRRQIRQIGRLRNSHYRDQQQIAFLKAELLRVITERFELNSALTQATVENDELKTKLAAAQRAHDHEERRTARYRLAWVSCRQHRKQHDLAPQ
jgi:hypothetical protein